MSKKLKILVTGAGGVVASYVPEVFKNSDFQLFLAKKKDLDVTKVKDVGRVFAKFRPEVVLHLAAKTNVDECEQEPKEAFQVNAEGAKDIARACRKAGATLVFASTAAIFPGRKRGYFEDDKLSPVNVYAATKLAAEKEVARLSKFYIVRAAWMVGGGRREKKFVSYIVKQLKDKKEIKVVNDKFGTLTYAREFVEFIKKLIAEHYPYGIYHFGSRGVASRYQIAKTIAKVLRKQAKIVPVSSSEFADRFFAPRPRFEVLKSRKVKFPLTWQASLGNYLNDEII